MKIKKVDDKKMEIHKKKRLDVHLKGKKGMPVSQGIAGTAVHAGLNEVDGGEEIEQAGAIAMTAATPAIRVSQKGIDAIQNQLLQSRKEKFKVVESRIKNQAVRDPLLRNSQTVMKQKIKQGTKRTVKDTSKAAAKKTAKETAKKTAKETSKAVVKQVTKETVKTATSVAATTAGTAASPGLGTAAGIAVGYVAGVAIDEKDLRMTNRNRKLQFFLDKMQAQEKQKDSFFKMVTDIVVRGTITRVKNFLPLLLVYLLALIACFATIIIPVILSVTILYNSPFALFMPSISGGDTVGAVAQTYIGDFNREVSTLASTHENHNHGQVIYVGHENDSETPSNYTDICAVYMVKYGIGDTATRLSERRKQNLKSVVEDMCSYTTHTKTDTYEDEEGEEYQETTLQVKVDLKYYGAMIETYGFNDRQVALLESLMSIMNPPSQEQETEEN